MPSPFSASPTISAEDNVRPAWKVLIVDDEEDVHSLFRTIFSASTMEGRGLLFLSAYSARQAKETLLEHPDVAIIILDVVMEEKHAGLALVKDIREGIGNKLVRIILHTGQPGEAPESEVIQRYDINDYRIKTDIRRVHLETSLHCCLRSYAALQRLADLNRGLEQIVGSVSPILAEQGNPHFPSTLLTVAKSVLAPQMAVNNAINVLVSPTDIRVCAATGRFSSAAGFRPAHDLPADIYARLDAQRTVPLGLAVSNADAYVIRLPAGRDKSYLLYLQRDPSAPPLPREIERTFETVLLACAQSAAHRADAEAVRDEIVSRLAGALEARVEEESYEHVRRIAEISCVLAAALRWPPDEIKTLRLAAPLHDFGMLSVSDEVLRKSAPLTADEEALVRQHTVQGASLLSTSTWAELRLATTIAMSHHENWDGTGYPLGTSGEAIPAAGRIVRVADVWDSLGSHRPFRPALSTADAITHMQAHAGTHFDPQVVDALLLNLDVMARIRSTYPDRPE